ncbi:hypothetical protein ACFL3E_02515, partial [Patescibacteria group bacterium]
LKTKSSALAPGFIATLNLSGVMEILIPEKNGLDILWSPDASMFLYSETKNLGESMDVWLTKTKTPQDGEKLGFKTLAEKCMWSKEDTEIIFCAVPKILPSYVIPDNWWMGDFFFEDRLWKINTVTGEVKIILNEESFDIIDLFSSVNEDHVFFINKKDSTLWSLKLE